MSVARATPVLLLSLLVACTGSESAPSASSSSPTQPSPSISDAPLRSPSPSLSPVPEAEAMFGTVRALAALGPREATSPAYRRAAAFVQDRLEQLGYAVRRQRLTVPAGVSWGVPVEAGSTFNVIAEPIAFDAASPHLIVGAHLDTVPQSPGANDNASGVAVLLELARLAASEPPAVPVVFIAFAAEEPRGPGDGDHHYGSRAYVALLERAAPLAMMSLDRVGIGRRIRVCTGGRGPDILARFIRARAEAARVEVDACRNRASDHWSFEKAGFKGARLLGADDPAYHTPRDLPGVVRPVQLLRVASLAWETLRAIRPDDLRR